MDFKSLLSSGAALIFVLCLIGLVSIMLRKYGNNMGVRPIVKGDRRLNIKEVLNIDARRKVVLISRDEKEHLIAFSENAIELIETNIENKRTEKTDETAN